MIFLHSFDKIGENKYLVKGIHYSPFDPICGLGKTETELSETGILVEVLPIPVYTNTQIPVLYINPQTKEIWYEYENMVIHRAKEEIRAEEVANLKAELASVNIALAQLMGV